jgi:hypothetical protein
MVISLTGESSREEPSGIETHQRFGYLAVLPSRKNFYDESLTHYCAASQNLRRL